MVFLFPGIIFFEMRTEVFFPSPRLDGRAVKQAETLRTAGYAVTDVVCIDVYISAGLQLFSKEKAERVFCDPVIQELVHPAGKESGFAADSFFPRWDICAEISYKPGVTDPVGITAENALRTELGDDFPPGGTVRAARQYLINFKDRERMDEVVSSLYNPLIERAVVIRRDEWREGKRPPEVYNYAVPPSAVQIETFHLRGLLETELAELSSRRLLALSAQEMRAVQEYFLSPETIGTRNEHGLSEAATDVELEMIAQTWSEHCKHKIFNAEIEYYEGDKREEIVSLFNTYIRGVTALLEKKKDFLRSVFHDNSGVVQFDEEHCFCFKVETHNSPSALDPYGGAITGIVGVNRDIIGTGKGAKPIFNTNVLCFGMPDTPPEELPRGLLHPKRVLRGVHHGIIDGGNQSGIPVAAGAFLFDKSYTGKPLVFCGTGGVLPAEVKGEASWIKHVDPGDKAVMVGGRVGKDGIHGATFSSLELNETSPTSAVQIGDPITQKKMLDFLLEARDEGLYKGITDNGAGGLSSSLGEMAELSGGVRIELDRCPLKYPGLAPWEILVSESQERMSLSVDPEKVDALLELASRRDVEATVVGEFTDSGYVEVMYKSETVAFLSLEFLHNGLPAMKLKAEWKPPERSTRQGRSGPPHASRGDLTPLLLALLSHPNVASKEHLVRQYDHEVQAESVVKPFCGARADGPSDGAVLKPLFHANLGITVTHGICPRYGDIDTYHMAMCALDEALRAHVACGGDPDSAAALDNFCWPDPVVSEQTPDGAYKLAQLVRACRGLYDGCRDYGIPLISGKDSMKNDARLGNRKVSVRPTLLISILGLIPDIEKAVSTDFKRPGDEIFLLGETRGELGGTSLEACTGSVYGDVPTVDTSQSIRLYRALYRAVCAGLVSSCHDLSDGGLAVACAESAFGGRYGAEIDIDSAPVPDGQKPDASRLLFCETPGRFVLSVPREKGKEFSAAMEKTACARIGRVTDRRRFIARSRGSVCIDCRLEEIETAWKSLERKLA